MTLQLTSCARSCRRAAAAPAARAQPAASGWAVAACCANPPGSRCSASASRRPTICYRITSGPWPRPTTISFKGLRKGGADKRVISAAAVCSNSCKQRRIHKKLTKETFLFNIQILPKGKTRKTESSLHRRAAIRVE
ncbi:hypothetical protein EVAR_51837_1 [Eumeta japonica]|uniref:Uncharacterized protein n=1 Tax=Eumeta variegata TaxID=151549 RepID=A0A4C1YS34_EUMVA|nr:hypothetical protein EVAR_51837_1 [Eumeta japonica]